MKSRLRKTRRSRRWSEDTHMAIASLTTIALIFALVIGFGLYGRRGAEPPATQIGGIAR